ncbi:AAA family ATPase [Undibacterium oligocarboniphilum]|uniref:AAA family ATPase n=1 Tax=Undibacterium oligocarboniphilum TaxID=666702 RepID=A0A850QGI7_9BURK|nr:AAA family ATPase [Undibacterium oligocarboniphilum]MBC3870407.1 AAA family ATPase [Undibacterium oligocarboniphilum]NVO78398.1 AAA family ATPase [Undibacterium oligocarboniphilum]
MSEMNYSDKSLVPLAEGMHSATLTDVIGQQDILGEGKSLQLAFESGPPHSMILWGAPGLGKTRLARLMADVFHCEFIVLSAVLSGTRNIHDTVERPQLLRSIFQHKPILFVDEVHRFNKAVKSYINQWLRRVIVQIIGLPHCSEVGRHA